MAEVLAEFEQIMASEKDGSPRPDPTADAVVKSVTTP